MDADDTVLVHDHIELHERRGPAMAVEVEDVLDIPDGPVLERKPKYRKTLDGYTRDRKGGLVCPTCHRPFRTADALHRHEAAKHGRV